MRYWAWRGQSIANIALIQAPPDHVVWFGYKGIDSTAMKGQSCWLILATVDKRMGGELLVREMVVTRETSQQGLADSAKWILDRLVELEYPIDELTVAR